MHTLLPVILVVALLMHAAAGLGATLEAAARSYSFNLIYLRRCCTPYLLKFRAQALAKYAFGLGLLQMFCCTAAFTLFALPVGNGIGTQILEKVR